VADLENVFIIFRVKRDIGENKCLYKTLEAGL
jgi:hypothetical protein